MPQRNRTRALWYYTLSKRDGKLLTDNNDEEMDSEMVALKPTKKIGLLMLVKSEE